MELNMGYFNICVNVKKNVKLKKEIDLESIKYQNQLKETIKKTKPLSQNLNDFNIF